MAWTCSRCKTNNSPWNKQCANIDNCSEVRVDWFSCLSSTGMIYSAYDENRNTDMDDNKIELHAKFFNSEMIFVADMSDDALTERRNELSNIIFEARARYNAADETTRTRRAKHSDKSWLVTPELSSTVSDAIATPKERKARQSKADKLLETMKSLGVENADELIKNVEKANSGGSITSHHTRQIEDKREQITFNKPNSNTNESLLGDISSSLVDGIKDNREEDSLVKAAVTAGHLANSILGPRTSELCKLGQHEQCNGACICSCHSDTQKRVIETSKPFNVDELFG